MIHRKILYFLKIRNQSGNIFQFSYGAGFGSSKLVRRTRKDGSDYITFINLEETFGKINVKHVNCGKIKQDF